MKTNVEVIQLIIRYIDAHLEEKLDLDSIAKEIHYSKYHLSRMFVNIVGFSLHKYIIKVFKGMFRCILQVYRKRKEFYPLQLEYITNRKEGLQGDTMLDIKIIDNDKMTVLGYKKNTRFDFFIIGKCWKSMHAKKHFIENRIDMEYMIGLNDYASGMLTKKSN